MSVRTHHIPAARPEEGKSPPARWLAPAVLCVSLLMVTLDNAVLNVALPTLVRDLGATTNLQWIVDSYVIVFAGLLLVGGSLADRVGRKRVYLIGLTAFALRSGGGAGRLPDRPGRAAVPPAPNRTEALI
jgi:MFS family permease